jgi:hypothetical protein
MFLIVLAHWTAIQIDTAHYTVHYILTSSQPVFGLAHYCYLLSGEVANNNCIVVCLTGSELEYSICCTQYHHGSNLLMQYIRSTCITLTIIYIHSKSVYHPLSVSQYLLAYFNFLMLFMVVSDHLLFSIIIFWEIFTNIFQCFKVIYSELMY